MIVATPHAPKRHHPPRFLWECEADLAGHFMAVLGYESHEYSLSKEDSKHAHLFWASRRGFNNELKGVYATHESAVSAAEGFARHHRNVIKETKKDDTHLQHTIWRDRNGYILFHVAEILIRS